MNAMQLLQSNVQYDNKYENYYFIFDHTNKTKDSGV